MARRRTGLAILRRGGEVHADDFRAYEMLRIRIVHDGRDQGIVIGRERALSQNGRADADDAVYTSTIQSNQIWMESDFVLDTTHSKSAYCKASPIDWL